MRGSRLFHLTHFLLIGIIPAHAGLTKEDFAAARADEDHPRACGAHSSSQKFRAMPKGSSPRMRGSRDVICGQACRLGIIPAHAGLTCLTFFSIRPLRDHPRACGAHCIDYLTRRRVRGSSPRMRGSHDETDEWLADDRIIPAHAGLTAPALRRPWPPWDHPRACGAHRPCSCPSRYRAGSSPRMRGSLPVEAGVTSSQGIIPAHAGLTLFHMVYQTQNRDHPRACGAHFPKTFFQHSRLGSSPRMRGSLPVRARLV